MYADSEGGFNYESLLASTTGSSHLKSGIPCEDFGRVLAGDRYITFAVADGHGDSNCPRSAYGSRSACEIACHELETFARDLRESTYRDFVGEELLWESKLFDPSYSDQLMKQLISSIVGNWRDDVLGNLEDNPLSEQERADAERYIDRYDKGERLEHIYGTTLIAGLATENYLILLQQGDGRCVVFSANGAASQPIPWDSSCFANVTTSLCDEDAAEEFRYYIRDLKDEPIVACILGTDGVEDSFFSMEQMHSFYRDLLIEIAQTSVHQCEEHLAGQLPEFSSKGSGDDVTICGIFDANAVKHVAPALMQTNDRAALESELAQVDNRLESMRAKLDYLKDQFVASRKPEAEAATRVSIAYEELKVYRLGEDLLNNRREDPIGSFPLQVMEGFNKVVNEWLNNSSDRHKKAQRALRDATGKREAAQAEYESYVAKYNELCNRRVELLELIEGAGNPREQAEMSAGARELYEPSQAGAMPDAALSVGNTLAGVASDEASLVGIGAPVEIASPVEAGTSAEGTVSAEAMYPTGAMSAAVTSEVELPTIVIPGIEISETGFTEDKDR